MRLVFDDVDVNSWGKYFDRTSKKNDKDVGQAPLLSISININVTVEENVWRPVLEDPSFLFLACTSKKFSSPCISSFSSPDAFSDSIIESFFFLFSIVTFEKFTLAAFSNTFTHRR